MKTSGKANVGMTSKLAETPQFGKQRNLRASGAWVEVCAEPLQDSGSGAIGTTADFLFRNFAAAELPGLPTLCSYLVVPGGTVADGHNTSKILIL